MDADKIDSPTIEQMVWKALSDRRSDGNQLQTHEGGCANVLCGLSHGYQICLALPQRRQLDANVFERTFAESAQR